MPTGYTAEIEKGIDFKTFVLRCSRAFGACIVQRDDNSEILPQLQESDDHHEKGIITAKNELNVLEGLTPEEQTLNAEVEFKKEVADHHESKTKNQQLKYKYERMFEKAKDWKPPTSEHMGLKEFMIEQLKSSLKFDIHDYDNNHLWKEPELKTGETWIEKKIEACRWSLQYHLKEDVKEKARIKDGNEWITQLFDCLKDD